MKQKLMSRKFWVAVATIVSGVLMMFGFAETSIETISGAIIALSGAIVYMVTEGKVDAERASQAVQATTDIVDTVKKEMTDDEVDKAII